MPVQATPGDQFVIRRKVLRLFGNSFHVYNGQGRLVAYCNQKRFRLREDIRLYTDESKSEEFLSLRTRQIIDFGATYDVKLPDGQVLCSLRRKGFKSTFLRDSWTIFGPKLDDGAQPQPIAILQEDSMGAALARRLHELVAALVPQKFHIERTDGTLIAILKTSINPFVYKLGVDIQHDDEQLDELTILACGVLIAAIEGRQD
jgi:hypothetical protein